jgi:hypothetical protein
LQADEVLQRRRQSLDPLIPDIVFIQSEILEAREVLQ